MKKNIVFGIIGWLLASIGSYKAVAQENDNKIKNETQEIIIRKSGEKDTKLSIEITNNKVMINGKPIAEFNEDGITINNRKMIYREGNKLKMDFGDKLQMQIDDEINQYFKPDNFNIDTYSNNYNGKPYVYLGVATKETSEGALITAVTKNSPAEKAGLQKEDVIYKIDDAKIEGTNTLSTIIKAKKQGDKIKVYFLREGKKKEEKVTLETLMPQAYRSFSYNTPNGKRKTFTFTKPQYPPFPPMPPLELQGLNEREFFGNNDIQLFLNRQKLGVKIQDTEEGNGVKILSVDSASAAATAGLQPNDVVTEIADKKITNTDEAREQLQQNKDKSSYIIKAKRNGTEMNFNIKIPKNLKTATL